MTKNIILNYVGEMKRLVKLSTLSSSLSLCVYL